MAFTASDVSTLESAIAAGAKVVRMDGREFEYQSIQQMLQALDRIKLEVNASEAEANGTKKRPRSFRIRHNNGY